MTEDIKNAGSQYVAEVHGMNKHMVEKALRMRSLAYLSQIKASLLVETIHGMNKSRKELAHLSLNLENKNKALIIERDLLALKVEERDQVEKQAQEILRRTHKMNSLGTMTSGISHDFNNMLGIVSGYADLLEQALSEQPILLDYASKIRHVSERGAKLTKKLLNFSMEKSTEAADSNINSLVKDEKEILEKYLTSIVNLELDLADDLWIVTIDKGDFEDALFNLCVNALHAIEGNGSITIQTSNTILDTIDAHILQLCIGEYVVVNITDTGCGMDEITKEKLFEPFYSTKGDSGTGLGLSQVYGFVARSGGAIKVLSKPGIGTCFSLYFPRVESVKLNKPNKPSEQQSSYRGGETILVVDDEQDMLELSCEILSNSGYNVISSSSADQALRILEEKSVDLVLSDIVMPSMNGYKFASIIREKYPKIKIQLTSGFNAPPKNKVLDKDVEGNILFKPYQSQQLLKNIYNLMRSSSEDFLVGEGKILVMDDEEIIREFAGEALECLGYDAAFAKNGIEAIKLYKKAQESGSPFDAVILDLTIAGGMGGKEVIQKLLELDPKVRAIISSGYTDDSVMSDFRRHGFSNVLAKPYLVGDLGEALHEVLIDTGN